MTKLAKPWLPRWTMILVCNLGLLGTPIGKPRLAQAANAPLPSDLVWETNTDLPPIGDPKAKKGGTLRLHVSTFPLTLRTEGPDSNTVQYLRLLDNKLGMVSFHPNNGKPIPLLASEWAFDKDGRSVYYRLNPKAIWSDGKPVTPKDFEFMLKFYRSENINAPWYNTYYKEQIEAVEAIGNDIVKVTLPASKPDMLYNTAVAPKPAHFYNNEVPKDFVQRYNWKVEPNTGPYIILEDDIKKGRTITWTRKKDWWGNDLPFMQHRFNVDKIRYKVIREETVVWEHFKKSEIDYFNMSEPLYWYERSAIDVFEKGWAHKLWFYNQRPQSCFGIWLNTQSNLFQDQRVREAIHYATNYEKVIKTLLRDEHERLAGCVDDYGEYTNPEIAARPFDLTKAIALMEAAGFTKTGPDGIRVNDKGQKAEFYLLYASDGHKDKLVVIVEEMKKAGIKAVLDYKDWSAMVKITGANGHEATFSGFGARDFGVPTYWGTFHGDNANKPNTNNTGNVNNPTLNAKIAAYRAETNRDARIKLSHEIQKLIHDEAVLIPATKKPWFRYGYWRWLQWPEIPATKKSEATMEDFDVFAIDRGGLVWIDDAIKDETEKARKSQTSFTPVTKVDETYRSSSAKKAAVPSEKGAAPSKN